MSAHNKLVKRLRDMLPLVGEVAALKAELKTATTLLEAEKWARENVKALAVADLQAEVERLKAALTEIKSLGFGSSTYKLGRNIKKAVEIARKALGDDAP